MHGWAITDSNGEVYKSWASAIEAFHNDPLLQFVEHAFSMEGHYLANNVTAQVAERAAK
jgi:hypothetical protein